MVLNADNCVCQNKNNIVLQYLLWCTTVGLSSKIELAFMIAGHTKFGPDYGFGVFKRLYRHADVNSVKDVCSLMSTSKLLIAEPVGYENGEILVPCYDWQSKFQGMGKVTGIKKYHHFIFDSKTSSVTVKEFVSSEQVELSITTDSSIHSSDMPPVMVPAGLTVQRQHYLFDKIRPYVSDEFKDTVCPKPKEDKEHSNSRVSPQKAGGGTGRHAAAGTDVTKSVTKMKAKEPDIVSRPVSRGRGRRRSAVDIAQSETSRLSFVEHDDFDVPLPKTRAQPTCSYCKQPGHRNAVRNGSFLCPQRAQDSIDN